MADNNDKKREGDPRFYTRWRKWLLHWHPELPRQIHRGTLLAVAFTMAEYGNFGVNCHVGDVTIGAIVERDRDTVARYRTFLIEHGAFVRVRKDDGKLMKIGRVEVLDIAIPKDEQKCGQCGGKLMTVPAALGYPEMQVCQKCG
jgi:hypothetical protein